VEGEKILGKVTTPTKGPRRPAYAKVMQCVDFVHLT
jgi:hypothetical protein